jgi:hypothetical protein
MKGVPWAIFVMASVAAIVLSIVAPNDRRYRRRLALGALILAVTAFAGAAAFALSIGPGWRLGLITGLPFVIVASVILWRSGSVTSST